MPTFEKSNLFLLSSVQILIQWDFRPWYYLYSLGNTAAVIIMLLSEEKDKTQGTLTHNGKLNLFPFGKQFQ